MLGPQFIKHHVALTSACNVWVGLQSKKDNSDVATGVNYGVAPSVWAFKKDTWLSNRNKWGQFGLLLAQVYDKSPQECTTKFPISLV